MFFYIVCRLEPYLAIESDWSHPLMSDPAFLLCINQVVKVALRICSAIAGLDD